MYKEIAQKMYVGGTPEINLRYWPHQHLVDWKDAYTVERWCYANFKGCNWKSIGNKFVFKRGQDATLFMLKWS